ncbi:hypothetical protein QM012_000785 [Aureobasidium pullulans]|uniref:HNH nuclease domain-containing protein n=1 Tax=Aureobasidium pullulans TaxID=5580 RepID=A0ABR0TEU4_AURPU
MTTSIEYENTLPLRASESRYPLIGPKKGVKDQVYSLVQLTEKESNELHDTLNQDDYGPHACCVVKDFQGTTLREAFNHHACIKNEDETVHPYFFIVLEEESSKSVLVVDLKAPGADGESVVGVSRCAIHEADLMGANLDVDNIDCIEYKEAEEEKFGSESPYTNERYFARDPREPKDTVSNITAYAWFSIVPRPLRFISILEPGWARIPQDERRFIYPADVERFDDPWSEIRSLFPRICQVNKIVHRMILLVAKKDDIDADQGMSIHRVLWDAEKELNNVPNNSDQTQQQAVRSIMPELKFLNGLERQ